MLASTTFSDLGLHGKGATFTFTQYLFYETSREHQRVFLN
jgi:hypothetical protein